MPQEACLLAAALVVLLHLAFVAFVVAGAALLARWPRLAWLHVPAVLWGAWIEFSGGLCPLTPLENHLRLLGGATAYTGDFTGHYLLPLLYPPHLTRAVQVALGVCVALLNAALYARWLRARRRAARTPRPRERS
jgi:hypothetical protein